MTAAQVKNLCVPEVIAAHKAGILGDRALQAEIGFVILIVLQHRQRRFGDDSIPVDFDICKLRLDTFRKIAGRDAV